MLKRMILIENKSKMGNCLGGDSGDTIINQPTGPITVYGPVTIINYEPKKKEPTYTSNQLYEVCERGGNFRRRERGTPMITEA
jgi:hypothetical protein